MERLRLVLEAPETERAGLRYAAEEVLRPLGLSFREEDHRADLYVGPDPPGDAVYLGEGLRQPGGLGDVFRWLSGARERELVVRDRWGRVPFAAVPSEGRAGPLATPVDDFRRGLADALRQRGVTVRETVWDGERWAVCLTHDLDALRTRRLAALVGGVWRGRPVRGLRRAVSPDERLRSAHALADLARRHGGRATFFVKAGESGREDVPASPERHARWFRQLRDAGHEIGLHPSIQAATDGRRLARERDRLAAVLGEAPVLVRSHFLRWEERITPALYAAAGFEADSTLGWSDAPGFRRGTAHPFRLWDGAAGGLWELPLAVMDTTLFVHQGLGEEAAREALRSVFEAARQSGGLAVVLWHNCMDGDPAWWRKLDILDRAIGQARSQGATLLRLSDALRHARSAR